MYFQQISVFPFPGLSTYIYIYIDRYAILEHLTDCGSFCKEWQLFWWNLMVGNYRALKYNLQNILCFFDVGKFFRASKNRQAGGAWLKI